MNREEHLQWAKNRALKYVQMGDVNQAWASMASDLSKHPELETHAGINLGMMMIMSGRLNSPEEMEKFIKGFN